MRFLALVFAFFAFDLQAQPPQIQLFPPLFPPIVEVKPSPTLEEYEKKLEEITSSCKRLKKETWKDLIMLHKVTKKEKTFDELSSLEQGVLMLIFAKEATDEMIELNEAWELELKKFEDPNYKVTPLEKIENKKQNPAVKSDVEDYIKQLKKMQRKFAKDYEEFAKKFVDGHKKELSEKEREFILSEIKKVHDKHNLSPCDK